MAIGDGGNTLAKQIHKCLVSAGIDYQLLLRPSEYLQQILIKSATSVVS
jgi:hypothetical protein